MEASQKLLDQAGFKYPVALTIGAWNECVAWDVKDSKRQIYQLEAGRKWQVLLALRNVIRASKQTVGEIYFTVSVIPRDGVSQAAIDTKLKVFCHPGDELESVITVMLSHED